MTWIETKQANPENPDVQQALRAAMKGYPREYTIGPQEGSSLPAAIQGDSVLLAHSLIPPALEHVFAAYRSMLDPDLPLTRREQEMIATMVSVFNDCYY